MLLALRALTGLALSGLPAVAMAYLADEIAPASLGLAMGLYISGSTLGGMAGRLTVAALADHWNWRVAIAALGVEGLVGAAYFLFALPRERSFTRQALRGGRVGRDPVRPFPGPGAEAPVSRKASW